MRLALWLASLVIGMSAVQCKAAFLVIHAVNAGRGDQTAAIFEAYLVMEEAVVLQAAQIDVIGASPTRAIDYDGSRVSGDVFPDFLDDGGLRIGIIFEASMTGEKTQVGDLIFLGSYTTDIRTNLMAQREIGVAALVNGESVMIGNFGPAEVPDLVERFAIYGSALPEASSTGLLVTMLLAAGIGRVCRPSRYSRANRRSVRSVPIAPSRRRWSR